MPDQTIPIKDIARAGVVLDTPPVSLPPNIFTDVRNVRFRDGAIRKMQGEVLLNDITESLATDIPANHSLGEARYVAFWPNPNIAPLSGYYIYVIDLRNADGGVVGQRVYIQTENADTIRNITPSTLMNAQNVNAFDVSEAWQHTLFAGGFSFIINNGIQQPFYILDEVGNTDINNITLAQLPGWDSYNVNQVVLDDTFGASDSFVFDLGQEINFQVNEIIIENITVPDAPTTWTAVRAAGDTQTPAPNSAMFVPTNLPDNLAQVTGTSEEYTIYNDPNTNTTVVAFNDQLTPRERVQITIRSRMPVNVAAGIIRSFGDTLVAGNLVEINSEFNPLTDPAENRIVRRLSGVVRTSDVAAPGSVPNNWNPFRAGASTADEFTLSDTNIVEDMFSLQGNLYIYTNNSIHVMRLTGNQAVPFSVAPVTDQYGVLTTDAVVEYDGKHFVVGSNDIYLFGGHPSSIQSISDEKIRLYFFENLSPLYEERMFVLLNQAQDEIWICYPTINSLSGECDEAAIWNYRDNTWTLRDLNDVISGVVAPIRGGGIPSATITISGGTGNAGYRNKGRQAVYSLNINGPVARPHNGIAERQQIQIADSFTGFETNRQEVVDLDFDGIDADPDVTSAVNTITIPTGNYTYDPTRLDSGGRIVLRYENVNTVGNNMRPASPNFVTSVFRTFDSFSTGDDPVTFTASQLALAIATDINRPSGGFPGLEDWTASNTDNVITLTSDLPGDRRFSAANLLVYTGSSSTQLSRSSTDMGTNTTGITVTPSNPFTGAFTINNTRSGVTGGTTLQNDIYNVTLTSGSDTYIVPFIISGGSETVVLNTTDSAWNITADLIDTAPTNRDEIDSATEITSEGLVLTNNIDTTNTRNIGFSESDGTSYTPDNDELVEGESNSGIVVTRNNLLTTTSMSTAGRSGVIQRFEHNQPAATGSISYTTPRTVSDTVMRTVSRSSNWNVPTNQPATSATRTVNGGQYAAFSGANFGNQVLLSPVYTVGSSGTWSGTLTQRVRTQFGATSSRYDSKIYAAIVPGSASLANSNGYIVCGAGNFTCVYNNTQNPPSPSTVIVEQNNGVRTGLTRGQGVSTWTRTFSNIAIPAGLTSFRIYMWFGIHLPTGSNGAGGGVGTQGITGSTYSSTESVTTTMTVQDPGSITITNGQIDNNNFFTVQRGSITGGQGSGSSRTIPSNAVSIISSGTFNGSASAGSTISPVATILTSTNIDLPGGAATFSDSTNRAQHITIPASSSARRYRWGNVVSGYVARTTAATTALTGTALRGSTDTLQGEDGSFTLGSRSDDDAITIENTSSYPANNVSFTPTVTQTGTGNTANFIFNSVTYAAGTAIPIGTINAGATVDIEASFATPANSANSVSVGTSSISGNKPVPTYDFTIQNTLADGPVTIRSGTIGGQAITNSLPLILNRGDNAVTLTSMLDPVLDSFDLDITTTGPSGAQTNNAITPAIDTNAANRGLYNITEANSPNLAVRIEISESFESDGTTQIHPDIDEVIIFPDGTDTRLEAANHVRDNLPTTISDHFTASVDQTTGILRLRSIDFEDHSSIGVSFITVDPTDSMITYMANQFGATMPTGTVVTPVIEGTGSEITPPVIRVNTPGDTTVREITFFRAADPISTTSPTQISNLIRTMVDASSTWSTGSTVIDPSLNLNTERLITAQRSTIGDETGSLSVTVLTDPDNVFQNVFSSNVIREGSAATSGTSVFTITCANGTVNTNNRPDVTDSPNNSSTTAANTNPFDTSFTVNFNDATRFPRYVSSNTPPATTGNNADNPLIEASTIAAEIIRLYSASGGTPNNRNWVAATTPGNDTQIEFTAAPRAQVDRHTTDPMGNDTGLRDDRSPREGNFSYTVTEGDATNNRDIPSTTVFASDVTGTEVQSGVFPDYSIPTRLTISIQTGLDEQGNPIISTFYDRHYGEGPGRVLNPQFQRAQNDPEITDINSYLNNYYTPFDMASNSRPNGVSVSDIQARDIMTNANVLETVLGLTQGTRRLNATREPTDITQPATTITIAPTQFSNLANFVTSFRTNIGQIIGAGGVPNVVDGTEFMMDANNPRASFIAPTTAQIISTLDGINGPEVTPTFSTVGTSIDTNFDVERPWPTGDLNPNRLYPVFIQTAVTPVAMGAGPDTVASRLRAADVGYNFGLDDMGNPIMYVSYIERQELGLTPEFDTEQLSSIALWADGGTSTRAGGELMQALLQVRVRGTDNPGEDAQLIVSQELDSSLNRKVVNAFQIGTNYKIDTRVHGRFVNYRIDDANPITSTTDADGNLLRNYVGANVIAWNISGLQFDIVKGGKR